MDLSIPGQPLLTEDILGNPDAAAEQLMSHVGLSNFLGGETGVKYKPNSSPFYHVAKGDPLNPNLSTFKEIGKMQRKTGSMISDGVKGLLGGASIDVPEVIESKFNGLYDTTNKLSETPDVFLEHLTNQTSPIYEHMPSVVAGLSKIAALSMEALKVHKPRLASTSPFELAREPSKIEISKFNRVANLLSSPTLIFKRIKDGTIMSSDVAMLDAVYPNLMNGVRTEIMRGLIDHKAAGKNLDYQTRLGLSKILGENMDSALTSLAINQMALARTNAQEASQNAAQAPQKASKSGISKMKFGERESTRYQQSNQRRP